MLFLKLLKHFSVVTDHRLILELQVLNRLVHLLLALRLLQTLLDADGLGRAFG